MKGIYRIIAITLFVFISNLAYGAPLPNPSNNGTSLSPMLKSVMPSMVAISGLKKVQAAAQLNVPISGNGLGTNSGEQVSYMIGSGVIVDAKEGLILTNAHVIAEMDEIEATLSDKRKLDAKVLGTDKDSDLALLQIPADNLTEVKFADSDQVEVGDYVVAIGNPYGFNQTVTYGIVSALGRSDLGLSGFYDFIQTDASINEGNSGGGLINLKGELVGINTALITPPNYGGNIGLGLAIPSNMAKSIMNQLATNGHVDRGPLGVMPQPLTPDLAKAFGVDGTQGAVIINVLTNSPAEKAGLNVGDVILEVDGKQVKNPAHLRTMISIIPIGRTIQVKLIRDKKDKTIPVKLTSLRAHYTDGETIFSGLKGVYLAESTPEDSQYIGIKVMEINPQSIASNADLSSGDVIIAANKSKTPSMQAFEKAAKEDKEIILMQVARNNITFFIAVPALAPSSTK